MSPDPAGGGSAAEAPAGASAAGRLRILVIAGSLRAAAYSRQVAQEAVRLAPEDVDASILVGLADVVPFDEDLEDGPAPASVSRLIHEVRRSHGVLIVTPEYNGSIPGQLKNAFDWLSRSDTPGDPGLPGSPMYGRPVVVASSSTGQFGGVWAADEMRKVLRTQGARVVGTVKVAIATAQDAFTAEGRLKNADHQEALRSLIDELVASARQLEAAGVNLVTT